MRGQVVGGPVHHLRPVQSFGVRRPPGHPAAEEGRPDSPQPVVSDDTVDSDAQHPGPDTTEAGRDSVLPRLRPVDLEPDEIFPVRYRSWVHELGDGRFVLSPDRRLRLRCVWVPRTETTPPDWQFWLDDLTGESPARLLCSTQKTFEPQAVQPSLTFSVVWEGVSQGIYVVARDAVQDDNSSLVWHIDLDGNARRVTHEAFTLRGFIVGSVPGSDLVVTQAVAPEAGGDPTAWNYNRVVVCDPQGNAHKAFSSSEGGCSFEEVGAGQILYSTKGTGPYALSLHLAGVFTDRDIVFAQGWLPRFRPEHETVSYFAFTNDHDLRLLEYDPETGTTEALATLSDVETIREYAWSADGKTVYVVAELVGDTGLFFGHVRR